MGANIWRYEEDWPVRIAERQVLYLGSDDASNTVSSQGLLSPISLKSTSQSFDFNPLDPVPTMGGAHLVMAPFVPHGPIDQRPIESRLDVLVHTGEVLTRNLEIIGDVYALLYVGSSAPCTDFTTRLIDVYEDGRALSVCDGIQRVLHPEKEADETRPFLVKIAMGITAYRFQVGHRIRLDVSSSNFPRFDSNPNTGESSFDARKSQVAHQILFSGPEFPSRIVLPVVEIQPDYGDLTQKVTRSPD
jgi:hypothetical protein